MRRPVWLCSVMLLLAACGDEVASGGASPTTVPETAPACEDYEGDALTDPCGPLSPTTAAPPATCTTESFRAAVATEIDGGLRVGDAVCDGDHLILDFVIDSCLPETEDRSRCARTKRAFFVRDGQRWTIVTYGDRMTCDAVRAETGRSFPLDLCRQAGAAP